MAQDYQIGALWIGGDLSFLEQLCLKSFVDVGHHVTLYSYEPIGNAPAGVELADAALILPRSEILRYSLNGSPALHADRFRYHLLSKCERMIWADTDAYCLRPFAPPTGHLYAWESAGHLNGGVLGLPPDSEGLARLLEFTADEYAIPPWYPESRRRELEARRDAGDPLHAGDMEWGVWVPHALTHFLRESGELKYALPQAALYPVPYEERRMMLRPRCDLSRFITEETLSIHFYGRRMRARILERNGGVPKPFSLIGQLLTRHGIDPLAAPLPRGAGAAARPKALPGAAAMDPAAVKAALAALGLGRIDSLADLGATAPALALAVHEAQDCDILLIDVDREGAFPAGGSDHLEAYRDFLDDNGVDPARVHVLRSAEALRPVDVLLNLGKFGDGAKIRHLEPFLARCLHADSQMLTDIRRKSGAYPFLAGHGRCEPLSGFEEQGKQVTRVLFRPGAPGPRPAAAAAPDPGWPQIARRLAGASGFFRDNGRHSFLHIPRGRTLVVSFDNLDITMTKREDRRPWGFDFIARQGWSMLGVMSNGWTWYRDPWVSDQFDTLAAEGFFAGFERVVFYGASMGGYAAAAFSGAAPGADVVAISPQSTVEKAVVPWESRYKAVWGADFSGKYGDAAQVSGAARRVTILYDPYEPLDAGHADRFTLPNAVTLRCPLLGHRLGSSLHQMGILNPIILGALSGKLTEAVFYRTLRARRDFPRYQKELFQRAVGRGHSRLARRMAERVLERGDNRFLRKALEGL